VNALKSQAAWDDEATRLFIDYGEAFVPFRDRQYELICRLLTASGARSAADLCCGAGKLAIELLASIPRIAVRAYDASPLMLETARAGAAAYDDRFRAELFDLHNPGWASSAPPVDAFVSSLALHHLTPEEKPEFYRTLHTALNPGGIFINADLIWPAGGEGRSVAAAAWDDWVKHFGERHGDEGAAFRVFEDERWNLFRYPEKNEGDYPLPIEHELRLLGEAGFEQIDVYWTDAGHSIFGGRKR
jgi:SAM-dependent methyltransferase